MAGRMSPLFQLWFSMTFPDQEVCKSTIIGTELVTTVECQRQCAMSATVCNVPDNRKSAACWKSLPVVSGCGQFNTQRVIGFTLRWTICANCYKNSMILQSFSWLSMTYVIFHDFWGLKNGLTKFQDFSRLSVTRGHPGKVWINNWSPRHKITGQQWSNSVHNTVDSVLIL